MVRQLCFEPCGEVLGWCCVQQLWPIDRSLRSKAESSDVRKLSSSEPIEAPTDSTRIQMELLATATVDVFEPAPTTTDLPATLPATDRVQRGIDMLIESLRLIGSIDELSMKPHYLEQIKPHRMTLEMLVDVCTPTTPVRWRR